MFHVPKKAVLIEVAKQCFKGELELSRYKHLVKPIDFIEEVLEKDAEALDNQW